MPQVIKPNKFRIRQSLREWWIREYTPDGLWVADHGPYVPSDFKEAESWALSNGWTDWDKEQ